IVDVDAVFLPDDFRSVRHFAKLFKYFGVEKLAMIGNHEWRSPALIEPFDEFLEGSIFADFIGSYADIPRPLRVPVMGSPYFIHPENVIGVDFQLIGYRVARTAALASQNPAVKRRHLARMMLQLSSDAESFFGNGPIFDRERS